MPLQKEVLKHGDVYKSQVLLHSKTGRMREMEIVGKEHGKIRKGRKQCLRRGDSTFRPR